MMAKETDSGPSEQEGEGIQWPTSDAEWERFIGYWEVVIRRSCKNAGLQHHDELDVTQTVMAVLNKLSSDEEKKFSTQGELGGYLKRVVTTQIKGLWKNSSRFVALANEGEIPAPAADSETQALLDLLPAWTPVDRRFESLIEQADESDRVLLRLRWFEQLRWAEIGVRLGMPVSTLYDQHRKALKDLRRRLESERP